MVSGVEVMVLCMQIFYVFMPFTLCTGALSCWNRLELEPIIILTGNSNAVAYKDILDNFAISTLWLQFGEGLHMVIIRCL